MENSSTVCILLVSHPRIRKRINYFLQKNFKEKTYYVSTYFPCKTIFEIACKELLTITEADHAIVFNELDFLEFKSSDSLTVDEFIEVVKSTFLTSSMYIFDKENLSATPLDNYSDQCHRVYAFNMAQGKFNEQGSPLI